MDIQLLKIVGYINKILDPALISQIFVMSFVASLFTSSMYRLYSRNASKETRSRSTDQRRENSWRKVECENSKEKPLPILFSKKQQKAYVSKKIHI